MTLKVLPVKRPSWTPITQEGCINVFVKSLLSLEHLALAMLRFEKEATIHEHSADFDVDVICLEGAGFVSVGKKQAAIKAGERARWPAGKLHRLWTTDDEMITLMVEHTKSAEPVWENVDSSMISAFKYDPAKKELEVMFTRTGMYRYFDVPEDVVKDLREADSKGSFLRYAVIDMFEYEKVGR
jgi:lysyl-tRNA synthetase class 2